MSEMIERIARVMHNEINPDDDYDKFVANNPNPQRYIRMARAAIKAMREPTEGGLYAAWVWSRDKYGKPIGNEGVRGCWQTLIDEALE